MMGFNAGGVPKKNSVENQPDGRMRGYPLYQK
jgi:hypothetical protein